MTKRRKLGFLLIVLFAIALEVLVLHVIIKYVRDTTTEAVREQCEEDMRLECEKVFEYDHEVVIEER